MLRLEFCWETIWKYLEINYLILENVVLLLLPVFLYKKKVYRNNFSIQ